jgi:hypothetical protein
LIRWFTIYLLAISALAFEAALIVDGHVRLAAALAVCTAAAIIFGLVSSVRPFAQFAGTLAALAGTGFGVWRSMLGDRYQTWTPAASIRR